MDLGQPFNGEAHLEFHQSELPAFPVKESLGAPGRFQTPTPPDLKSGFSQLFFSASNTIPTNCCFSLPSCVI